MSQLPDIEILNKKEVESGWVFKVGVMNNYYTAEVDESYWKDLTNEEVGPATLVKKSFEFLLEREPASAIMNEFNLRVITEYFPEYEEVISR